MDLSKVLEDLTRQITRLIGTANALMERYARSMDEIDGIRLGMEEQREIQDEHFNENAHQYDRIAERMDRLEKYVILSQMGRDTVQIETVVAGEHLERELEKKLGAQQELIIQYDANIAKVKIRMARFGETVPSLNELEDYQNKIEKAEEVMDRIREALRKIRGK